MGALVYTGITSLDGRTADEAGDISWAAPGAEVHRFITETALSQRTLLYGRRMYETMLAWEVGFALAEEYDFIRDFQQHWRDADKVVYSSTLSGVRSSRTRLERVFDAAAIARDVRECGHDVSIGGAALAGAALRAGIVDEVRSFVVPVTLGGGTPFLPEGLRARLDLREERVFRDGTVYLRYGVRCPPVQAEAPSSAVTREAISPP